MTRRQFLRVISGAMAAFAMLKLHLPESASASTTTGDWIDTWWSEDVSDEAPVLAAENPTTTRKIDKFCLGRLRLKSAIHGEEYEFNFRDPLGNYDKQMLKSLDWFLRCKDGSWQSMDICTIESLNYLSALLERPLIHVNSGYRSPSYNARLALRNENVARNSLHQYGRAIDFCIPGIPIRDVCSYTLYARNVMGYGGVGYYPAAGFVHLDSGRVKQWVK